MSKNLYIWLWVGLASAPLALAGCGQTMAYDKTQYVLEPIRTAEPVMAFKEATLEVRRFMIDSAFRGKSLVYRTGDLKYETDFYHEFLVSPAAMIREATRNWLAQSNLVARVVDAGGYVDPTYALEANITTLYGDARDEGAPKAVLELRAFLLRLEGTGDPVILHNQVYSASQEVPTADADGLVAGFSACLQAILSDLEKDLAAKL
ncbi:MAG: membrane integrity-associated transporter subunit PqiC [Phycisphaerales bacterium]|nr:MAG: membrane integrity-associated transporter subunit PqiC [Phycisphaerales bacterium]